MARILCVALNGTQFLNFLQFVITPQKRTYTCVKKFTSYCAPKCEHRHEECYLLSSVGLNNSICRLSGRTQIDHSCFHGYKPCIDFSIYCLIYKVCILPIPSQMFQSTCNTTLKMQKLVCSITYRISENIYALECSYRSYKEEKLQALQFSQTI